MVKHVERNSLDYDNAYKLDVIDSDVSLANRSSRCNDSIGNMNHVWILEKNVLGILLIEVQFPTTIDTVVAPRQDWQCHFGEKS